MKSATLALSFGAALACAQMAAAQSEASAPLSKAQATSAWSEEGLQPLKVKGLDVVYARANADLGAYARILLGPVTVAFQRGWERNAVPGARRPVSAAESQRIRDRLAKLVRAEVVQELGSAGYELVDAPGDNVLEVDLAIVNLQVNAPDLGVGRTTSYAVSAGEMTLVAELRDSASGEVLMRVFDRALAREWFRPQRITSVDNAAEARTAAQGWAKALRTELDLAKQASAK
jgi:uncharacterized protein DUF3313